MTPSPRARWVRLSAVVALVALLAGCNGKASAEAINSLASKLGVSSDEAARLIASRAAARQQSEEEAASALDDIVRGFTRRVAASTTDLPQVWDVACNTLTSILASSAWATLPPSGAADQVFSLRNSIEQLIGATLGLEPVVEGHQFRSDLREVATLLDQGKIDQGTAAAMLMAIRVGTCKVVLS